MRWISDHCSASRKAEEISPATRPMTSALGRIWRRLTSSAFKPEPGLPSTFMAGSTGMLDAKTSRNAPRNLPPPRRSTRSHAGAVAARSGDLQELVGAPRSGARGDRRPDLLHLVG